MNLQSWGLMFCQVVKSSFGIVEILSQQLLRVVVLSNFLVRRKRLCLLSLKSTIFNVSGRFNLSMDLFSKLWNSLFLQRFFDPTNLIFWVLNDGQELGFATKIRYNGTFIALDILIWAPSPQGRGAKFTWVGQCWFEKFRHFTLGVWCAFRGFAGFFNQEFPGPSWVIRT